MQKSCGRQQTRGFFFSGKSETLVSSIWNDRHGRISLILVQQHNIQETLTVSFDTVSFDTNHDSDDFDAISARFGIESDEPRANRQPGKKPHKAKKSAQQITAELSETPQAQEGDFRITYKPARYEAIWLRESLEPFFTQALIEDVLALVKGGKEANVYLCKATPHLPVTHIAAKVYRPRQFRNLRNDKMYREGRELLNGLGLPVKDRDNREMRAVRNKTNFGAELTHISWLMHEYVTLQRLHTLGAAVPLPVGVGDNAILMDFVGAPSQAAPVLHGVALTRSEAQSLFAEVMRNIELMLQHGMIHGDLSAYNILYWDRRVTLIDFPQVTLSESNHNAYRIFQRDVRRVCEYFAMQGVACQPSALAEELWQRYVRLDPDRTVQDVS
jgi:serine/threonine-protein kinase RIO1